MCASATSTDDAALLPEERGVIVGAGPDRVTQFATGRHCARLALAHLGADGSSPLLPDARGAPRWPAGITGSITHTPGWTGALVARTGRRGVAAVGLDAERAAPLPAGVLDVVASPAERERLARLTDDDPSRPWDVLLFSAKEAAYKAWYPLAGTVLAHDAVAVDLRADGRFLAVARAGRRSVVVRGAWHAGPHVVVTLGVVVR
ncbi:MAG: 4'-phosphopantetheinyl transferase family protein [Phycicoccus sp.]